MATGGFHLLVAVAGGWDMWRDIIMDGFAASIGNDAERAYTFVFSWLRHYKIIDFVIAW